MRCTKSGRQGMTGAAALTVAQAAAKLWRVLLPRVRCTPKARACESPSLELGLEFKLASTLGTPQRGAVIPPHACVTQPACAQRVVHKQILCKADACAGCPLSLREVWYGMWYSIPSSYRLWEPEASF